MRTMEARAEAGGISRSSAHRIVGQQMIPRCHQQLQAFLASCEVPENGVAGLDRRLEQGLAAP
ncbi:hypothetical protein [Streptomyces sp. TM32]|uniref:hypothetical protein n=1 Tax=Streptomyces sp. TM32 TaxID=1652669 RepID=UPI0020B148AE|nr:hypothetical protein [Streptomyces sp. TM32]